MATRNKVLIAGAGFAGLTAVRALRGAPVDLVLLDKHNYHTFSPLLYQVASALLEPAEIAHPIRSVLRGHRNLEVRLATVTGVDLERRQVFTERGVLPYNFLILATGSQTNFFGLAGMAGRAYGLKALDQALALRNRVLARFEAAAWCEDEAERRRLLTFAVVGGGPTGVEYAGALSELIRNVLRRDYPRTGVTGSRILLIEAAPHLLGAFHPSLREHARRKLEEKGVEVLLDRQVARLQGESRLELAGGEAIEAGTVIWTAGVKGADLGQALGVPLGRSQTVRVEPTLQLGSHPEVFVVGDLAGLEQDGQPLPMLIPVAMQEARHAAGSIRRMLAGRPVAAFRYRDPGMMATIGRNAGIAEIGPLRMSGFLGWLVWLGFHLLQIVSLRSRLVVLVNWAWDYLLFDRPVRLLLEADRLGS